MRWGERGTVLLSKEPPSSPMTWFAAWCCSCCCCFPLLLLSGRCPLLPRGALLPSRRTRSVDAWRRRIVAASSSLLLLVFIASAVGRSYAALLPGDDRAAFLWTTSGTAPHRVRATCRSAARSSLSLTPADPPPALTDATELLPPATLLPRARVWRCAVCPQPRRSAGGVQGARCEVPAVSDAPVSAERTRVLWSAQTRTHGHTDTDADALRCSLSLCAPPSGLMAAEDVRALGFREDAQSSHEPERPRAAHP